MSIDKERGLLVLRLFLKTVGVLLLFALWLAVYAVLVITFFIETGWFRGVGGWVGLSLFVYILLVIPILFTFILWSRYFQTDSSFKNYEEVGSKEDLPQGESLGGKHKEKMRIVLYVVAGYLFILLLTQVILVFINPVDGIFPLSPLNADAFAVSEYRPAGCDVAGRYAEAVTFFANSTVKASGIPVVYGGMPAHFGSASAVVIDSAIYLDFDLCPSVNLLVHEIVHLWQIQTGWWFERGASLYWSVFFERMECADCPYDYGGLQGLQAAKSANKRFLDFGPEQQAQIVQDYYIRVASQATSSTIFPLLKEYAEAVLNDNIP